MSQRNTRTWKSRGWYLGLVTLYSGTMIQRLAGGENLGVNVEGAARAEWTLPVDTKVTRCGGDEVFVMRILSFGSRESLA